MHRLPRIMVAPNGARLTKADHPTLPVTIEETVAAALAARAAGADGLHAHVRDAKGAHVLDAGLYRELLAEMATEAPGFYVQITTEAVGRYTPSEQRALIETVVPPAASIGLREIDEEPDRAITRRFFAFCAEAGVHVQHILSDQTDIERLAARRADGTIPAGPLAASLVLGRYTTGQVSDPADVAPFAAALKAVEPDVDWSLCAFGPTETLCLVEASRQGGKMRVGFENNRVNANGIIAGDNSERVRDLCAALERAI